MKTIQKLRVLARASFAPADSGWLDVVAFCLLLVVVFIAPFLYGSRAGLRPFPGPNASLTADLTLEILAFVTTCATLLSRTRLRSPGPLAVPVAMMSGLVALGVLQLLPLPQAILASVSPVNLTIYHETGEILALFGRKPPAPRFSIVPSSTQTAVLLLLACFGLFFCAANLLRTRERRRVFALAFFASALLQVLVLTLERPASGLGRVAAYLELALALAFGALWAEILTNRDRASSSSINAGDRFETRSLPLVGRFLLWALVAFGLLQTGSRVALLAAATATLAVLAAGVVHRRVHFPRQREVGALLALLAVVLFAATLAGARPLVRFLESDPGGFNTSGRIAVWRTAYRAWQDFPIVGSGLGTFPEAVRRVQPRELVGRIEYARFDPLQILVTGGAVGLVLAAILYISLFLLLLRSFREQPHREESAMILGGLGALLSLTIFGLMDSAYSTPSVPAVLACLLGAAWAAARQPRGRSATR